MGVGLQVLCLGFPRAASIDVEAGVQLVRLERFSSNLHDCHLTIEVLRTPGGFAYDARLDLLLWNGRFVPMPHCSDPDPARAIRAAFDHAVDSLAHRTPVLP